MILMALRRLQIKMSIKKNELSANVAVVWRRRFGSVQFNKTIFNIQRYVCVCFLLLCRIIVKNHVALWPISHRLCASAKCVLGMGMGMGMDERMKEMNKKK